MATRPLVLAYTGFVSLGLPDTVLGVASPTLRDASNNGALNLKLPRRRLAVLVKDNTSLP